MAPDPFVAAHFAAEERLLQELDHVARRVRAALARPMTPGQRLALADDLLDLRRRIRAAQAALRTAIRGTSAAHAAASAYRRIGLLRR